MTEDKKKTKPAKSNDFVIVDIKNSQEKVSEGDVIEVNRIAGEKGDKMKFDTVLLSHKDGKTLVGKPLVEKAVVEMEILEQFRGEKIHVKTFKAKSRYRRHIGHRQELTRLKVVKI